MNNIKLSKIDSFSSSENIVILIDQTSELDSCKLKADEVGFIKQRIEEKKTIIKLQSPERFIFIIFSKKNDCIQKQREGLRKQAYTFFKFLAEEKCSAIKLIDKLSESNLTLAFVEGLILSSYKFSKYFTTEKEDKTNKLEKIKLISEKVTELELNELSNITKGVFYARDLINEPLSYLSSEKLSQEIKKMGLEANFSVEVLGKDKLESLKFGGLLAVNKGSATPPTFSILEWKPKNAKNENPIILVGKGIVYDTGGLSLKPTANSMDYMKSDMGGAAAVAGAMYSIALSKLPVHVIALIPSTENSISAEAYVPGDVIKMHNGLTVEVLNTDAEGRLILADALSYAQAYKPELVLDFATLTGAAAVAVGKEASVVMGTASDKTFEKLEKSAWNTFERVVRFPFWDEYNEYIKSNIADIKNIGGRDAGAITAGKFLEHFTDYDWIHIDIAGPAFSHTHENYKGIGGTGVGVRLCYDFIKNYKTGLDQ